MIVMTISNWKRKLKLLLLLILIALIAGGIISLMNLKGESDTANNDRDANGSLKVEATTQNIPDDVEVGWWDGIMETLKDYCQDHVN